jgi:hypothetical protein
MERSAPESLGQTALAVYLARMSPPPPRIPPPPVPTLDWSTPAAYLDSCYAWLDRMQEWQAGTLPEWIEQSRRYLLQRALLDPETKVSLPDAQRVTAAIPAQPLLAVQEMRLPSVD